MMAYRIRIAGWMVAVLLMVVGVIGCGDDEEQIDFDCEEHEQCLEDEACIEEICVDAPDAGDSCPSSHEGDEYDEFLCLDGQWTEAPDPPQIESIDAAPSPVIRGGSIELEVIVTSELDDHLSVEWSAPEGWALVDDDAPNVALEAHEEAGQTATIEVVVVDPFGGEDDDRVTVETETLFCGGEGTAADPWDVCSARFVNRIAVYDEKRSDHFELTTDVDMAELDEEFGVVGDDEAPFDGVFDGGGHIIENLSVETADDGAAIFGHVGDDGEVRDLRLGSVDVQGGDQTGAVVGRNEGTVFRVSVTGSVAGDEDVGGLAGRNARDAFVFDSYATGEVDGDDSVGGFVGGQSGEEVVNSYWDVVTSETSVGVGSGDPAGVTGLETGDFSDEEPHFADWDFEDVWEIGEAPDGPERPVFQWQE